MNNLSEQNALQTDLRNELPINSLSKGKLYVAHKNWALIDFCELHNLHSTRFRCDLACVGLSASLRDDKLLLKN